MNSGAKAMARARPLAWFSLLLAGAFAFLAAGCSDHGPTNLYSNPLFGQTQSGATMQIWGGWENSLSSTAGVGPDQYLVKIKNLGSGAIIGPVTAHVTMVPACSGTVMQNYAGTPTASQTVIFGAQNQAIYSGETLVGYASDMSGPYQYSVEVAFPNSCSNTTDTFSVTMTDSKADQWSGTFTGSNI
ncbi:MAG TPA: hypothetical protein VK914_06905 [bacterium]|jgi:hypothetical protein|nr:hypothetical protein [bacterium]